VGRWEGLVGKEEEVSKSQDED